MTMIISVMNTNVTTSHRGQQRKIRINMYNNIHTKNNTLSITLLHFERIFCLYERRVSNNECTPEQSVRGLVTDHLVKSRSNAWITRTRGVLSFNQ